MEPTMRHVALPVLPVTAAPYSLYHLLIMAAVDGGIVREAVNAVQLVVLYLLHDVRSDVMPTVGDGCGKVGNLQRSGENLSLPDGYTDNGQSVPRTPIGPVIELGIRNQSALLAGKVGLQPIAESLRHHVVFPHRDGIMYRAVLLVAEHAEQPPAEIRIAGSGNGGNQR